MIAIPVFFVETIVICHDWVDGESWPSLWVGIYKAEQQRMFLQ